MGMGCRNGLTMHVMRVCGRITKLMGKVSFGMLMAIYMRENG